MKLFGIGILRLLVFLWWSSISYHVEYCEASTTISLKQKLSHDMNDSSLDEINNNLSNQAHNQDLYEIESVKDKDSTVLAANQQQVTLLQTQTTASLGGGNSTDQNISPWQTYHLSEKAFRGINFTLATLGLILGLCLAFVGIRLFHINFVLLLSVTFGIALFALIFFSSYGIVGYPTDLAFVVSVASSVILSFVVLMLTLLCGGDIVSQQTVSIPLSGLCVGFLLGMMVNTIGMYHSIELPYYSFMASVFIFMFPFAGIWYLVALKNWIRFRTLHLISFAFAGAFYLLWGCGGLAQSYPGQFNNLRESSLNVSWSYYAMFICTFLVAFVGIAFQSYMWASVGLTPRSVEEANASSSSQSNTMGMSRQPSHASSRLRFARNSSVAGSKYEVFGRSAAAPQFEGV